MLIDCPLKMFEPLCCKMGMGWPLGPASPASVIRNQTKAVVCPCRNPDVPTHRGPGIDLVILLAEGYSRSRNCPDKANQNDQGSSSNSSNGTEQLRAFAMCQALV